MVVANPTLDSISAFSAPDGSGNVTATVSFSGQYAPTYVLGTNTYIAGQKISISGADDSQNNGRFIIVSVTGGTTVAGTIVFANPSGVAKSNQFAVCSPAPIMLKDTTTDVAITIATPFSYAFEASSQWTPPPAYTTSGITGYAYATSNGYDPRGTVTGTTSLTIPFHPASGDTIINIYLGFAAQTLQTLYPYKFNPTITLPVVTGVPEPNGSSYVTFDVATPSSKCLIYGNYSLGYPTAVAAVGSDQYIVDKTNSVIRKLTAGVPTIFAGQIGVHTNTDGVGLSAAFTDPVDIVYANSKLYVSDGTRIRSIVISTATVSTIVTGGNIAGANGLAWDGANLLYVACNSNGKVCSVNLTTFAVTVITTGIAHPTRIAYDFGANLYVTDAIANKIYQIIISGGTTTVLAGTGTAGSADGSLTAATFSGPVGITFDEAHDTLFVCDTGNNTLRAIDIGLGWVWTIAGLAGTSPADVDGAGTVARFNTPTGILWKDPTHMIISEPTGSLRNVTVVYTGASATVATSLLSPLTLATNGNYLYVACNDTDILRIDTTNGTTTTTSFGEALDGLKGITVDSTGTYMYAAALSGLITRIALLDNIPTTVAGVLGSTSESDNYLFTTWATPPLMSGSPYLPIGCAVGGDKTVVGADDGNIYVWAGTEWLQGNISGSWRAARTFPLIACSGDGSIMVAAPSISNPVSTGNYVVSISTNSGADWFIGTITGSDPSMIAAGIAISNDGLKIYVSDPVQHGVWIGTGAGTSWAFDPRFSVSDGGQIAYAYAPGNSVTGQDDIIAVVNSPLGGSRVVYVGLPGAGLYTYDLGGGTAFNSITMTADGHIAVSELAGFVRISPDFGNNWYISSAGDDVWKAVVATSSYYIAITNTGIRVSQSLDPTTQWYTLSTDVAYGFFRAAVSPSGTNCIILSTATTDVYSCTGPSSTFNLPQWIAIDSTDTYLYVTDAPAGTVRQITLPTGQVTTVATGLVYPQGIVMANSTHVYVADRHRIVYIDVTSGTKTVIAGSTSSGNVNGNGATARFNNPQGLALDSTNSILYVADFYNDAIRRIDLTSPFNVTTLSISQSFTQPIGLVLNSALTSLYVSVGEGELYSTTVTPTTTVSTSQSTIPTGANAVIIGGNSYIYTTPATLTCTPAIDGLSYSISFNGGSPVTFTTTTGTLLPTIAYAGIAQVTDMTILYRAPIPISAYFPTEYPYVRYITGTSADLVPFISSPDTLVTISSTEGFIHSGTLTYVLQLFSDVNFTVFETASNSFIVTAFSIIVTPPLTSPLDLYMYGPFTYTFSLPEDTVNVTLNAVEYSSSALIPYISSSSDKATLTFSSTGATVSSLLQNLNVKAFVGTNPNELTSSSTVVNILPAYLVATPPIPSGVPINLYKYEEFTYAFAVVGLGTTLTLRYSRSSVQLAPYIKVLDDGSIEFTGTPPASYSSTFVLAIDLMNGTSVVSSLDYPVTISAGRIKFLPASPYALNQYENISNTFGSNIAWESSNAPDSIVSIPTLPYGLSFSSTAITGIPQTQQAQRNYQIIGSNSTNGSISTANIAISVGVPVVRISPASASFAGLGIGSTPTTTFTALVPATIYSSSFVYTWSPSLPAGLVFTDIDGNILPNLPYYPPTSDAAKTIKLAGTPTMTDAAGFPSSGLVTVTLSGIYKDATNVQTIGTATLALQFAETVLMTANVSSSLYVGKLLGSNDVTFTAASYFPRTSPINSFVISDLPPGLSLASSTSNWYLTGTPTSAGTTAGTITAVNSNSITNTIPYTIVINPDIVTFTSFPTDATITCLVSLQLSTFGGFQLAAAATSGSVVTYTSSIDLSQYGLSLNPTTGLFSGTPTATLTTTTIVFTATDALGASTTLTRLLVILPDIFTWPGDLPYYYTPKYPTYAPAYFQNRLVTPYQIVVRTQSGRAIQSFSSTNMPAGLTLSPSGLITGTPTVSTGGTFTVTATTGYQAPPTASKTFTYTVIADNLLMVQVNGVDPISNAVFNAPFITIPYSTGTSVNPVYSFTTYPLQYPAPVFTVSQSGVLTGDFTGVPAPYSLYNAGITATYGGITNTTNVVISISNAPTPFLVAGYWNISGNGLIVTTAPSYVFNASTSGTPVIANQTWTTSLTATDTNVVGRPAYPDIATNGSGLVAVTPSNVYDGAYNSTTNSVNWTASISSFTEIFGCVISDGGSNWVIVAKTGTAVVSYERSGNAGAWTRRINSTGFITNPSSMTTTRVTLGYVNGYYVYGQYAASGAYCNVLYRTVTGTAWRFPATPPALDEVYRFATSNTTIVAVGYGTSPSYNPMSYSTSLTTWASPTLPAWLSTTASTYVYDIAYGGGMWVMVGMAASVGSFIAYSPDLSNWVQYIPTTPSGVQSLATWSWVSLTFNGNAWTIAGTYYTTGPYYHSGILTLDAGQWPNQTSKVAVDTMVPSGYLNPVSRIVATAFSNTSSFSGTVSSSVGPLTFTQPTQSAFTLYRYVPYDITVQATGASGFKYYYAFGVPVGFQFTPESTGTTASIAGISPSNGNATVTLYAKTASSAASATQIQLNTVIPFFVNPQSGAGAYTAIVREHVDADAAQNARDNRTFPQVDSLAGPFMAPRAPDVVTQSNCFLGLCKKPCPTCRTMM